jgi:UDP-glucose 4-epimerase
LAHNKVLVTGGAGYIGSHICKALAEAGFAPVVFDDFSTGHRDFVRWGPLVEGDIRDDARLRQAMTEHAIAHVVHCAAESLVAKSVVEPELFHAVNVDGTRILLDAMQGAGCRSIVFSSSGAVYGVPHTSPIIETAPCVPVNPYGETKLAAEALLTMRRRDAGLQATALRYFNAAGADPAGEIGERHDPETHLVPRAIGAALWRIGDFCIFGTDYDTADGTAIRDYVHVSDIAQAHVLALRAHEQGSSGGAFNIGAGRGVSVKEIIAAVESSVGKPVPVTIAARRAGDPSRLAADIALARAEFGFNPQRSDLAIIVRDAVAWHLKDNRVHA